MVVALKYKLLQPISIKDGTYSKDGAKEFISKKIVPRAYVNDRNAHNNNELYIIDEEATEEMLRLREESIKSNTLKQKRENVSFADLVEVVAGKVAENTEKPKKKAAKVEAPKEESEPSEFDNMDLFELREYCDENDITYHHKSGKEKLIELIKAAK